MKKWTKFSFGLGLRENKRMGNSPLFTGIAVHMHPVIHFNIGSIEMLVVPR
jgi:hypothetical protein